MAQRNTGFERGPGDGPQAMMVGRQEEFRTPTKVGTRIATGQASLPIDETTYEPIERRPAGRDAERRPKYKPA